MNKTKTFATELEWIEDKSIKEFAEKAISMLPDYFFEVAASSTGKYHPEYALGPGGLVRHTKAAVMIAHELLNLEMYGKYTQEQRDLMLVALMLHDGWKHGKEATAGKYTVAEHPVVCSDWILETPEFRELLTEEQLTFLAGCVVSHMGQWNTDYRSKKEIMPKPVTAAQKFIHQADYLASRKYLLFDFGDNYYSPGEKDTAEKPRQSEDTPLDDLKANIIAVCKDKIANGADKEALYSVITDKTGGNRNPNSITDVSVAQEVLKCLEEFKVG